MSERSAKRALGNLPGKEAPDYDVGYGKPPRHSRFKPGQSGNPRGRPRGALDRKNRIPSINREHMKQLVRQEAYRTIGILDGGRPVEVPVIRVIIRNIALSAAKGDRKSQQMIVELVRGVEREDKMLHDELVTAAIEYKSEWESELERREQVGQTGPKPLPHPGDITIDVGSGRVEFRGPMTKEEKSVRDELPRLRAEFDKEIATLEELAAENPNSCFVQQQLKDRRRMRARLRKVQLK